LTAGPACDSARLVQAEPRVATILTFSTQGDPRSAVPRRDTQAEVIVFPRTDVRALRRLSEQGVDMPPVGDRPPKAPGDDSPG
jgi:hypothetical protein